MIKNDSDSKIQRTLTAMGVPVERLFFIGESDTYITWQVISGNETAFADDDNEEYEHFYRVDLFSRHNYVQELVKLRKLLKKAGFHGTTVNAEQYEKDTGYYHASINTYLIEE